MSNPFAGIEASINAASLAAMSNSVITWGIGQTANGTFSNQSAVLLGDLVQASTPEFVGATAQIGSLTYGTPVSIGATAYTVARNEPDGTGVTRLLLQKT